MFIHLELISAYHLLDFDASGTSANVICPALVLFADLKCQPTNWGSEPTRNQPTQNLAWLHAPAW